MEKVKELLDKYRTLELINDQQYYSVLLRFGLDNGGYRTLQDIGNFLGVSDGRVKTILWAGLKRLRAQDDFLMTMNTYLREHPLPKMMLRSGFFTSEGILCSPAPLAREHYQIVEALWKPRRSAF